MQHLQKTGGNVRRDGRRNIEGRSPTRLRSIPFLFTLLRTPSHNGQSTTPVESIASALFPSRRRVYESVWQLCWLGEFLVISMIHLHSSEVVARCGLDFLCAGDFQRGLSCHMRARFNAVVARANSAATFPSPRIRNLRIPRCSFKIPMTGSASAFRRRYHAHPAVEANLLRLPRRAGLRGGCFRIPPRFKTPARLLSGT